MSDIFISYKREEQAIARKLANALESEGWSVWWDPKLRSGERFDDVIEKALNEAKCVIVVWSEVSVESRYVRNEATYALEKDKLVPVAIGKVNLPFRFEGIHTQSLLGWDGSKDASDFRRLVESIAAIVGSPVSTPRRKAEVENRRRIEKERNRAEQEAAQRRLEAAAQLKAEEERRLSEEESRRKAAEEEKEKNHPQHRPQIMTTYDVFISFKNLDENGAPTRDAQLANEVYKFLTNKGLSVFISTVTLENLGVSNYKKAIDDALDAASIMIAVGTSTENLNSEWVRYEWDGFFGDILSGVKPGGRLFTYVAGLRPVQLPRTLRQTQTFIHSSESLGQLHGFIVQALR